MSMGSATFKSNVLLRDEKGFVGIPFKRLLLAGVGGGLTYSASRIFAPDWSISLAIGFAIVLLAMTSPRGGIPRWQRLLYRLRGSLMLTMLDQPDSLAASLGKFLELRPSLVLLDGAQIFVPVQSQLHTPVDWSEWVTFSEASEALHDEGLVVVESPVSLAASALGGRHEVP
jgi:hypothetical protein